jgi:DNA-binding MarR family transcriptional regulator
MTESQEIILLLREIVSLLKSRDSASRTAKQKHSQDERVALAVVAIARGASSYQEIADQLGVSRGTVSRNLGIRRAMESSIRDRRPADREAVEEFRLKKRAGNRSN